MEKRRKPEDGESGTVKMEGTKMVSTYFPFKTGSSTLHASTFHTPTFISLTRISVLPILATRSTSFSTLPIASLSVLSSSSPKEEELTNLSVRLDEVFSATGFAFLTDLPLTFAHGDIFGLCDEFFGAKGLSSKEKMKFAKKTFVKLMSTHIEGKLAMNSTNAGLTKV
jgi:hypothetical protein